jgi:hypothetical protein
MDHLRKFVALKPRDTTTTNQQILRQIDFLFEYESKNIFNFRFPLFHCFWDLISSTVIFPVACIGDSHVISSMSMYKI